MITHTHSSLCFVNVPPLVSRWLVLFEVQMKSLKRVFCKMFGKMEFFWCHVIKCVSSPAERALTLTLTGFHTGEKQELVVPCKLEVLYLLTCCKCCSDRFVHMLEKHHGRISGYLFI